MTCLKSITGNDISMHVTGQALCGVVDSNPEFEEYQRTGGKSEKTVTYVQSGVIKTNKQGRNNIKDGSEYGPYTLETELSKQSIQWICAGLRCAEFTEVDYTASTISFVSADNSINDSASGLGDVAQGAWLFVDGEPYYIESVVDATKVIVSSAQPLTDIAEGASTVVKSSMARSADNESLFTVQKRIKDLSAPQNSTAYITQTDALINAFNLTLPSRGVVTTSATFTAANQLDGKAPIAGQTDRTLDAARIAVMGAVDAIDNIWINFAKANVGMADFSLDVDNALSSVQQAGNPGAGAISLGGIAATGSLNSMALETNPLAEIEKLESGTRFSLSVPFKFPDGSMLIVTMRKCVYTEVTQNDGPDEIVQSSGTYAAEEDSFGTTVQIDTLFL